MVLKRQESKDLDPQRCAAIDVHVVTGLQWNSVTLDATQLALYTAIYYICRNSLPPPPNQEGKITAIQHWNKTQNNLGGVGESLTLCRNTILGI